MSIKAFLDRLEEELKEAQKAQEALQAQKTDRARKRKKASKKPTEGSSLDRESAGLAEERSRANKEEARWVIQESRQTFRDYKDEGGEKTGMGEVASERSGLGKTQVMERDPRFSKASRPSREEMRKALVWKEILGPPKARRR